MSGIPKNDQRPQKSGYDPLRWLEREIKHTKDLIVPDGGFKALFSRQNMVKAAAFGAVVLALNNPLWTNPANAVKTAETNGLSDVSVTGYDWFGCGIGHKYDLSRTKVEGTNAAGQHVSATVCKGPFHQPHMKYH